MAAGYSFALAQLKRMRFRTFGPCCFVANRSVSTSTPRFVITKESFYEKRKRKNEGTPVESYALLIVPVVTFCLGTWQLYRLKWKLGLIEERTARMRVPPLEMKELPNHVEQLRELEYRRVKLTGIFDHEREIYLGPRSPLGSQSGGLVSSTSSHGVHVITPFKIKDTNVAVLVDRGWVQKNQINPLLRPKGQVEGEVTVIGALRNSEAGNKFSGTVDSKSKTFFIRDIDTMSDLLKTAPVFIELTSESDIPGGPIGGQTIVQMRNEHLNYAITWYSLSIITAFLWYYKYVKKRHFR